MLGRSLLAAAKSPPGMDGNGFRIVFGDPVEGILRPVMTVRGHISRHDVRCLTEWRNRYVSAFLTEFIATEEGTTNWLSDQLGLDETRILFMVDLPNGKTIGYMGIAFIDWTRRYAEADAVVRGEDAPRGLIAKALRALLLWARNDLGLPSLGVRVRSDNSALTFYKKFGFKEIERVPLRRTEVSGMVKWIEDPLLQNHRVALVHMALPYSPFSRIEVDLESGCLSVDGWGGRASHSIGTPEAFSFISHVWLRSGWDNKYVYSFSWLGRPIIQLPEDMIRIQEVIFTLQPDVIVETGVAHGGSLVFYASLCKAMGKGRVVGVDIEIRPPNRNAIESHLVFPYVTLIEGSSIDPQVVSKVREQIKPSEKVLVLLDSCHSKSHVLSELAAYAPMVSRGSYIVAMDGIMEQVAGAPRTGADWTWNNPKQAALEFVAANPDFEIKEPPFPFNEGNIKDRVTYWPSAWLWRR